VDPVGHDRTAQAEEDRRPGQMDGDHDAPPIESVGDHTGR